MNAVGGSPEASEAPAYQFEAFLAHNSEDKSLVGTVRRAVLDRVPDAKLWYDEEQIKYGSVVAEAIDAGVKASRSVAFFVGPGGPGAWQTQELWLAVTYAISLGLPLVGIMLPGFDGQLIDVSAFLGARRYLDLRDLWEADGPTDAGVTELVAALLGEQGGSSATRPTDETRRPIAHALVIGVSAYDDEGIRDLHGPRNDVDGLIRALDSLTLDDGGRWNIAPLHDPQGRNDIIGLFDPVIEANLGLEDLLLVYFSGHSVLRDGATYLCTKGTRLASPHREGLLLADLVNSVNSVHAGQVALILDCCHTLPDAYDDEPHWDHKLTGDHVAVIAALGNAPDAGQVDTNSPLTEELIRILKGESRGRPRLTVGDLCDSLDIANCRIWTNEHPDRGIVLAASRPLDQPERKPAGEVEVLVDAQRLPDGTFHSARMITRLIGELLVLADDFDASIQQVLADATSLIGEVLAGKVLEEGARDVLAEAIDRLVVEPDRHGSPNLALRFAGESELVELADVPWEMLAFFQRSPRAQLPSVFPVAVERLVTVPALKHVAEPPQRAVLYREQLHRESAGGAKETDRQALARLTEEQLPASKSESVARKWGNFTPSPGRSDIVILQMPVEESAVGPAFLFYGDDVGDVRPVTAEMIAESLSVRSVRFVVIESSADRSGVGALQATWRGAACLARTLKVDVVAVCHPRRLLKELRQESSQTFVGELVRRLMLGASLREATAAARRALLFGLGRTDGTAAGIPVLFRAVEAGQPRGALSGRAAPNVHESGSRPAPGADEPAAAASKHSQSGMGG